MADERDRVVVVGAGVAGLAAAAMLARAGLPVHVVESRPVIGGCCGTTEMAGFRFNDGAQYLMLPHLMGRALTLLGIDPARLVLRRATTPLRTELGDGTRADIHPNLRVERHAGSFDEAQAQAELEHCLARWQPLLGELTNGDWLFGPLQPVRLVRRLGPYLPLLARSLQAELESLFTAPAFRAVMAGHLLFAGAPARSFPAASILALVSVLADGLFAPEGGMGGLPEVLAEAVRARGGTFAVNAPVRRLRATANGFIVEADGLDPIACRAVVSTISPYTTLGGLLADARLPSSWRRRLSRPRLSMKVFAVQLGLRGGAAGLTHLNHFLPGAERFDDCFKPPADTIQSVYASVPSLVAPGLAPPGGSVVELYPAIPQAGSAKGWDAARRDRFAEQAVAWLRGRQPVEIAVQRVRSPLEFEAQLGLVEGGIYGVDPAAGFGALFPRRTPVRGLFLAGQSTFPGFGVPMAIASGLHAARLVRQFLGES